jgi:hypothetical protein
MKPANKIPIPSYDELKKNIDELLLIDKWDRYRIKTSPKKFKKRMYNLFVSKIGLFPTIYFSMKSNELKIPFYRLRKETKTMNNTLISEYSYPPNNIVKFTQRANLPYHPVFYCADRPLTALMETIRDEKTINQDATYYLSKWEFKDSFDIRVTPFLFGNVHAESPYKLMSDENIRKIENVFNDYSKEEIESVKKIMLFLSHLFIYDNTYVVSSYIAHNHIYADHDLRTDIFIYPSHQADHKQMNYAIHPNVVIEKLQLKKVYSLNVEEYVPERGYCRVQVRKIGKNIDSIIFWETVSDENDEHVNEINWLLSQ